MVPGEHITEDLVWFRELGRLFWDSRGEAWYKGWVGFNWVKNKGKRTY